MLSKKQETKEIKEKVEESSPIKEKKVEEHVPMVLEENNQV